MESIMVNKCACLSVVLKEEALGAEYAKANTIMGTCFSVLQFIYRTISIRYP